MKSIFPGYYKPSEQEFKELWAKAIFVLDTNVLLDLYRYSDDTVEALLDNITNLKDKIWIPYRVCFEYHRNLNDVISDQISGYKTTIETLQKFKNQLDAKRSHPFLSKEMHAEIQQFCEKFDKILNDRRVDIEKLISENPIKERIANLLNDNIGKEVLKEELEAIYREGEARYSEKLPPGYLDAKNKQGKEKFGDLLIWKEIIKKSKENKLSVILITGDVKDDWFHRHSGKVLGPRPELTHEFIKETGQFFYAYPTSQFLEYSNIYFETKITKEVIEEVEKIAEAEKSAQTNSLIAEECIPEVTTTTTSLNTSEVSSGNNNNSRIP